MKCYALDLRVMVGKEALAPMTQKDEKRDSPPPPTDDDMARQLEAARIGVEKYKEALRELAKH